MKTIDFTAFLHPRYLPNPCLYVQREVKELISDNIDIFRHSFRLWPGEKGTRGLLHGGHTATYPLFNGRHRNAGKQGEEHDLPFTGR